MIVAEAEPRIKAEKAMKILARALDPACLDGEAETSGVMFVRACRRDQVALPDLVKALAIVSPVRSIDEAKRPPACEVEFTFGKYDGWAVGDVAMRDPGYLIWAIKKLDKKPELVSAMRIAADYYGLEVGDE